MHFITLVSVSWVLDFPDPPKALSAEWLKIAPPVSCSSLLPSPILARPARGLPLSGLVLARPARGLLLLGSVLARPVRGFPSQVPLLRGQHEASPPGSGSREASTRPTRGEAPWRGAGSSALQRLLSSPWLLRGSCAHHRSRQGWTPWGHGGEEKRPEEQGQGPGCSPASLACAGVGAVGSPAGHRPWSLLLVFSRILRLRYKIFKGARRIHRSRQRDESGVVVWAHHLHWAPGGGESQGAARRSGALACGAFWSWVWGAEEGGEV